MRKKLIVTTASLSLALTSFGSITSLAESNNQQNKRIEVNGTTSNSSILSPITSNIITDVDQQMNKISDYYYNNNLKLKDIGDYYHIIRLENKNTTMSFSLNADDIKNLQYNDLQPQYIGENEFRNTTDQEQTFTTASYSQAVTNSVSSTVIQGFKATSTTSLLKIPILLPEGINLNAEFNSASNTTTTNTTTETLTAPPQNIKVPAGRTYKVEVNLLKKKFTGDIDFHGKGTDVKSNLKVCATYYGPGFPRPTKYPSYTYSTADMWRGLTTEQKKQITGVNFNNNKDLTIDGTTKVEGIYGSNLEVVVYDITNKNIPKMVETRTFK
ncbi:ETX/MTX2 family pore-forming toxin [Bacillus cereus]|uniref:ETX/MTX2 family pore-forming toxin n=1 Tax=Bacillus cereus TaxID=1396 RepID=UPI003CF5CFA1